MEVDIVAAEEEEAVAVMVVDVAVVGVRRAVDIAEDFVVEDAVVFEEAGAAVDIIRSIEKASKEKQ